MSATELNKTDRITRIGVDGLRTLAALELDLGNLSVVIGENGAGKSSIAEACVLLYRLAWPNFSDAFHRAHGGFASVLRHGARDLFLSVRIEGAGPTLDYGIVLQGPPGSLTVRQEQLSQSSDEGPILVFRRNGDTYEIRDSGRAGETAVSLRRGLDEGTPLLASVGPAQPMHEGVHRLRGALQRIVVHLAPIAVPTWAAPGLGLTRSMRDSVVFQPARHLELGASNLPNVFHALRSGRRDLWEETLERVRLGLGDGLEDILVQADPGGGKAGLFLKWRNFDQPEPAWSLSDGQLSYLALVAMFRIGTDASLLVYDEPEAHLHPTLLQRVMQFFLEASDHQPVLLFTQSDRILDELPDPARSAILLQLDHERRATALRPTARELGRWLEKYRGLGQLRAEGFEGLVFHGPNGAG